MCNSDKKAYIDAVKCLQSKPARTPASEAPGAKTRFDDFVVTHINQTQALHYTGSFLAWHRYFTWLYEQALRDECGYTGTQPVSRRDLDNLVLLVPCQTSLPCLPIRPIS